MKKILLGAMMILCAMTIQAEDGFKFSPEIEPFVGINLGATTSLGVPEETEEIFSSKTMICPAIGVMATQMLSNHWRIQAGLIFERKGGNSKVRMKNFETEIVLAGEGTPTHGYFTGISENHHSVYYLTLPVRAVYRTGKWDLAGGMYFSYALSRSRTGEAYDGKIRTSPLIYPAIAVSSSTSDWSDKIPRFDCGVSLGASYPIWKDLRVKVDANWGLLNTLDAPESGLTMNVYNLFACIGLGWRF